MRKKEQQYKQKLKEQLEEIEHLRDQRDWGAKDSEDLERKKRIAMEEFEEEENTSDYVKGLQQGREEGEAKGYEKGRKDGKEEIRQEIRDGYELVKPWQRGRMEKLMEEKGYKKAKQEIINKISNL